MIIIINSVGNVLYNFTSRFIKIMKIVKGKLLFSSIKLILRDKYYEKNHQKSFLMFQIIYVNLQYYKIIIII